MHVGKVVPTLMMGHGHPPAQVLAEPATPGAQLIQHMAPVLVLTHHPGDPPLERDPATPPCRQLTMAQIEWQWRQHQRRVQCLREARRFNDSVGDQLKLM